MWTPKRVLLLVAGFGLFFSTYAIYAHFLGGIDGLPPLPKQYFPSNEPLCDITKGDQRATQAERKLAQAFGNDCDEMKRPIKLLLNTRGLVLASNVCDPQPDGRVLLKPFSIAIFSKDTGDGRYPEINTVRSSLAYISFDKPVHTQTEIAGRKIVGGELQGTITLINNRRTPRRTDDLQVNVSGQPLYYLEKDHRIWTKGVVRLIDTQTTPNPTQIDGTGMDLFLTPPQPATVPAKEKKQQSEALSGVDRIVLHTYVTMHLYVDGRSGFLSTGGIAAKSDAGETASTAASEPVALDGASHPADARPPEAEKDKVYIECKGPFNYDLRTDVATFDTLNKHKKKKGNLEEEDQVLVKREHAPAPGQGRLNDQILCDHLDLKFRRKTASEPSVARASKSGEREIETARATGDEVTLSLDGPQGLEAFGNELFYRSPTAAKGSLTILKGAPLEVAKDGNHMRARELWMQGSLEKGGPTLTTARGPGQIDMADRNVDIKMVEPRYPVHITWNDMLVSTKDGPYDLYTLTGGASFIDDDHKQQLHGKRLQVWLVPADATKPPANGKPAAPSVQATPAILDPARQRPRRLEAFEHVRCYSPEMNVQEAEHLTVKFKDAPPGKGVLPPVLSPAKSGLPSKDGSAGAPAATGSKIAGADSSGKSAPPKEPAKPAKKPMDIWARSVVAHVIRYGDKNEMQTLLTEGNVHVHQDGSTPQDKGVDITGEILELYRDWESYPNPSRGDILVVFSDSRSPAKVATLQLGNLTLRGPKVTIDQKENTAEVKGAGTMRMPSNTTLNGKKSAKPDAMLDVYWNTGMLFNGKDAEFDGGAIAVQDDSQLQCRTLQVSLDKYVSLKEGQKVGQGAKVEQMVCDKKVNAEEITRLEGKLQKYSKSESREMTFDSRDERTYNTGPGKVYLLQLGSMDEGAGRAPRPLPMHGVPKAPAKPKEEMKLTRVEYEGSMLTYKVGLDSRTTVFRDHVEVVNAPCPREDIYMAIDKDKPPERGMYLRSAVLTVYTSPDPRVKGKNTQTLVAENQAYVKTPEYQANAWKITYEESSDLVKFEGKNGVPVLFVKLSPKQGAEGKQFRGDKILYNRKTRQFKVEDGDSIRIDD